VKILIIGGLAAAMAATVSASAAEQPIAVTPPPVKVLERPLAAAPVETRTVTAPARVAVLERPAPAADTDTQPVKVSRARTAKVRTKDRAPRTVSPGLESIRKCIVKRESEGQYTVRNKTSSAAGAYQFVIATSNEAARRMQRSDLIGVPASQWSRRDQDRAFYVIWNNGRGRAHWAGGRWACW